MTNDSKTNAVRQAEFQVEFNATHKETALRLMKLVLKAVIESNAPFGTEDLLNEAIREVSNIDTRAAPKPQGVDWESLKRGVCDFVTTENKKFHTMRFGTVKQYDEGATRGVISSVIDHLSSKYTITPIEGDE